MECRCFCPRLNRVKIYHQLVRSESYKILSYVKLWLIMIFLPCYNWQIIICLHMFIIPALVPDIPVLQFSELYWQVKWSLPFTFFTDNWYFMRPPSILISHHKYFNGLYDNIVQLGPKLKYSAQVLAQSEHYIWGGIHPPDPPPQTFKRILGILGD